MLVYLMTELSILSGPVVFSVGLRVVGLTPKLMNPNPPTCKIELMYLSEMNEKENASSSWHCGRGSSFYSVLW